MCTYSYSLLIEDGSMGRVKFSGCTYISVINDILLDSHFSQIYTDNLCFVMLSCRELRFSPKRSYVLSC